MNEKRSRRGHTPHTACSQTMNETQSPALSFLSQRRKEKTWGGCAHTFILYDFEYHAGCKRDSSPVTGPVKQGTADGER